MWSAHGTLPKVLRTTAEPVPTDNAAWEFYFVKALYPDFEPKFQQNRWTYDVSYRKFPTGQTIFTHW